MRLNFFGRGSAFLPDLGNTNAYFHHENNFFMLDCGESTFHKVWQFEELEKCDEIVVLVTHLHADHVGSLGSLLSYCYCVLNRRLMIVHPEETIVELLDLLGIERKFYDYSKELPERFGFQAEPIPVKHVDNMKCYGYLLKDQENTIYYSGDAATVPDEILGGFLTGEIEKVYQDVSTHEQSHPTHCHISTLEELIPPEKRNQVYCMHLDQMDEEFYTKRGFQVART